MGQSRQVEFRVKDPFTNIIWLRESFRTFHDFHRWLKKKGFNDSYTKIYKWLVGTGTRPLWYNNLIYEVDVYAGGDVENLTLELKLSHRDPPSDDEMSQITELDECEVNAIFS